MKKCSKKICVSIIALFFVFTLMSACNNNPNQNQDPLIGRWEYQKTFDTKVKIFYADGTYEEGIFDSITGIGTYTVNGNTITTNINGKTEEYEYTFNDRAGTLHLTQWNRNSNPPTSITLGYAKTGRVNH